MVDINEFLREYENNPSFKREVLDYFEAGPGMADLDVSQYKEMVRSTGGGYY